MPYTGSDDVTVILYILENLRQSLAIPLHKNFLSIIRCIDKSTVHFFFQLIMNTNACCYLEMNGMNEKRYGLKFIC